MKVPHPKMEEFDDVSEQKTYAVKFKAVIRGVAYLPGKNKAQAAQRFKEDEGKQFDKIEEFINYKITSVEEI